MVPKLGDCTNDHKCCKDPHGSYSTRDHSIRDEPKPTPTAYVLCIHHVLGGNYTIPRYVAVRTRTRWNRELSQINCDSVTQNYPIADDAISLPALFKFTLAVQRPADTIDPLVAITITIIITITISITIAHHHSTRRRPQDAANTASSQQNFINMRDVWTGSRII